MAGNCALDVNGTRGFMYDKVGEENPDDAADEDKSGTEVTTPWLGIFHGQFVNPGKETASPLILVDISC